MLICVPRKYLNNVYLEIAIMVALVIVYNDKKKEKALCALSC